MAVIGTSSPSANLMVGDRWHMRVVVVNDDGDRAEATVVFTVTLPNASTATPTVVNPEQGVYETFYTPATVGRFTASAVASGFGQASFSAYVQAATTGSNMPDIDDVKAYLETGGEPVSHEDDQIQDALDAEAQAQRDICIVSAVYPASLRQALLRRVARNLAMRMLPLSMQMGDAESAGIVPGRDPEVRRLEGPYRRMTVG